MHSEEIMSILPHRYPLLMIDRVSQLDPGKSIVAHKNVSINENFFNGHFPGHPIMPGVLIVEALAQAAGIMIVKGNSNQNNIVYFMSIEKATFRHPVVPGDVLNLEVSLVFGRSSAWKCTGYAKVGDKICAEATFVVAQAKGAN